MRKMIGKIIIGMGLTMGLTVVGGNVIPAFAPVEAKAYSQYVRMQSIYHENENNVVVLFKADESDYGCFYSNVAYIHVKNENTGEVVRYQAVRQSTDENYESLYKACFSHQPGEDIKIKIEFVTVSNTGHQQSLYDDNGGHWYQCHSWN